MDVADIVDEIIDFSVKTVYFSHSKDFAGIVATHELAHGKLNSRELQKCANKSLYDEIEEWEMSNAKTELEVVHTRYTYNSTENDISLIWRHY